MQELNSLLDQLKAAGITPAINISFTPQNPDAQQIITLNNDLKTAGIIPEIHIHIHVTQSGTTLPVDDPGSNPVKETGVAVVVKVAKTNCMEFKRKDNAGKPIMDIHEPRIQLFSGAQFMVSATHKAGDKDTGDGVVLGTGGFKFYFVVDCPSNRSAEGLYVRQSDVSKV